MLFKTSVEERSAALGKLFGVQSLDGAIQVRTGLAKAAYDGLVASSSRFGDSSRRSPRTPVNPSRVHWSRPKLRQSRQLDRAVRTAKA